MIGTISLITVFLSSLLLFLIQPMVAKEALPLFGGASSVWTTCMLFFQSLLLFGYLYAHVNVSYLGRSKGIVLHIALVICALLAAIFTPREYVVATQLDPVVGMLLFLTVKVGLPYFVLSATAPLVQGYLAAVKKSANVHLLYGASNAAAFIALLAYPVLIESNLALSGQQFLWRCVFAGFALAIILCLWMLHGGSWQKEDIRTVEAEPADERGMLWFLLPAVSSIILLSVTNQLCQNIAAVPLLWIIPLALYLLTYAIAFSNYSGIYIRKIYVIVLSILLCGVAYTVYISQVPPLLFLILAAIVGLFLAFMICHSEFSALRPNPEHLTRYYLISSIGSVAGSFYVAVLSPLMYMKYSEFYAGFILLAILLVVIERGRSSYLSKQKWFVSFGVILTFFVVHFVDLYRPGIAYARNFYGTIKISDRNPEAPNFHYYRMHHGAVVHGLQFRSAEKRNWPTTYYGPTSGIGRVLSNHNIGSSRNIAAIGLGVGTIAAYGRPQDTINFYELNPAVEELAERYFTFMQDSAATINTIIGDGRLAIAADADGFYDVIFVDAFSGDAIPAHLITVEAIELYLAKLKIDGIVALHISNMYLDLVPLVVALAAETRSELLFIIDDGLKVHGQTRSYYAILAKNPAVLSQYQQYAAVPDNIKSVKAWRDDFSNLLSIVKSW